ncbi:hypothetical protein RJ639_024200 [Escallonia herrerae]|uniref:START domain-containing protein n=1 Tax=Escallonia herrerae TaxID=1293975 RepID=A0AA89AEU3_9ASTE|nr:hypothetical protein RJ639_024200 [Escallonia herrerae]
MDFGQGGNGSSDDHEETSYSQKSKKQYHRHSAQQIQHLEVYLAQNERADNNSLRAENERIHCENLALGEALKNVQERLSNMLVQVTGKSIAQLLSLSPSLGYSVDLPADNILSQGIGGPFLDPDLVLKTSKNPMLPYRLNGMQEMEKSQAIEIAAHAMDELIELLRVYEPVWIKLSTDGGYTLHRDSYYNLYPKTNNLKSSGARIESSKDSGVMAIAGLQLVEMCTLMWLLVLQDKWVDLFPTIVTKARTIEVIDTGNLGGSLQLVTWVEHVEVDDRSPIHRLYRDLVCSGQSYGAKRWITTLQRICERFAYSLGSRATQPSHELDGVVDVPEGRKSLMKLSHRMVSSFCSILSMSEKLDFPNFTEMSNSGVRISVRTSTEPSQPHGVIVSAATSLWLPLSCDSVFNFFRDEKTRAQWDVLSSGNPVNEIAHVTTGSHPGNCISIMQPFNPNGDSLLILQESCIDPLVALIVYAPVDLHSVTSAINGQDMAKIPLLPSGFIISDDGHPPDNYRASTSSGTTRPSGSLVTVALQVLLCSNGFSQQLTMESVTAVHNLISSAVQNIKAALNCPDLS